MTTKQSTTPEEILLRLDAEHDRLREVAIRATDDLHEVRRARGMALRAVREVRGLSRLTVAGKLGTTPSHLIGIEMGRPISDTEFRRLMRVLGVRRAARTTPSQAVMRKAS